MVKFVSRGRVVVEVSRMMVMKETQIFIPWNGFELATRTFDGPQLVLRRQQYCNYYRQTELRTSVCNDSKKRSSWVISIFNFVFNNWGHAVE